VNSLSTNKRRWSALLALLTIAALLIAACGGQPQSAPAGGTEAATEAATGAAGATESATEAVTGTTATTDTTGAAGEAARAARPCRGGAPPHATVYATVEAPHHAPFAPHCIADCRGGGPARRSRVLDDKDRRVVAYHEAGRALVMEEISKTEAVGKITIVSRGQSLGYVMPLPDEDKNLRSRTEYEDSIAGLLAGRAAEEMIFNEPSTRAATDLERVTKVAKAMVTRFGMSDVIGPVQLQHGDANPFMGMDIGEQRTYSEDVARKIDREVRRIVEDAYGRAKDILTRRRDQLVLIAETLLEKEVLDRQEFLQLIGKGSSPQAAAAAAAD